MKANIKTILSFLIWMIFLSQIGKVKRHTNLRISIFVSFRVFTVDFGGEVTLAYFSQTVIVTDCEPTEFHFENLDRECNTTNLLKSADNWNLEVYM